MSAPILSEHEADLAFLRAVCPIADRAARDMRRLCAANNISIEDARMEAMTGILAACEHMDESKTIPARLAFLRLRARTAITHLAMRERRHAQQLCLQLDEPVSREHPDAGTKIEMTPAEHVDPDEMIDAARAIRLALAVDRSPIEDAILSRHLYSDEPARQLEIAASFGVCRETVRRAERSLLDRMRKAAA